MSATDVVVGRLTRRIRQARLTPGEWQPCLSFDVRWLPGSMPNERNGMPVHDGYYEVLETGRAVEFFAYPHVAAGYLYQRQLEDRVAKGETIENALRETNGW